MPSAPASREAQLMALWEIQEYVIKPQLRTVPGVAEVNAYGGYVKQIVVTAENREVARRRPDRKRPRQSGG